MKKVVFYFNPKAKKIFVEKTDEDGQKKIVLSSRENFVYAAETVARVIEVDSEEQIPTRIDPGYKYYNVVNYSPIKAGTGIYYDEVSRSFKASSYGFITLFENSLRLIPLVSVTRDKIKSIITVFPTKFNKIPTVEDVEDNLRELNVISSIGTAAIQKELEKIDTNLKKITRIVVANGKQAVEGVNEYYTSLLDFEKKAGTLHDDGSIDFKEVGSIVQVKKGDKILQRNPEIKAIDGYDVFGNKIVAKTKIISSYKPEKGIVNSTTEKNILVANLDGCLELTQKKISVSAIVVIKGDVDYEYGNVDFNGSVVIYGSVLPGFSVKAAGDITIEQSVEDSEIIAGGDITIKMGAVGKNGVKLITGGSLFAKYLLNADVEAVGDVIVEDSIINCNVFSNNKISVLAQSGKIIGGDLTAFNGIEAKVVGAVNETLTKISVGRNLFVERELAVIQEKIDSVREDVNEIIGKLRMNFGEEVFENPMEYIKILPSLKKKNCLIMLKELSEGNGKLKGFLVEKNAVEVKLELLQEPVIKVFDKVYPGTTINLKKMVRKISEIMDNVKFYEDKEQKIIRFTVAS